MPKIVNEQLVNPLINEELIFTILSVVLDGNILFLETAISYNTCFSRLVQNLTE